MELITSKLIYENRWMSVMEDRFRRTDGSEGVYGLIAKADFAIVIPFEDGHVYLVEQYRYPVKARFWEFPQGSWETIPDLNPEDLARSELQEETGLAAGSMTSLGYLYEAYGYSSQRMHAFLATELTPGEQNLDQDEAGLIFKRFSLAQFKSMVADGTIRDNATLAAYGLWQLHLERQGENK